MVSKKIILCLKCFLPCINRYYREYYQMKTAFSILTCTCSKIDFRLTTKALKHLHEIVTFLGITWKLEKLPVHVVQKTIFFNDLRDKQETTRPILHSFLQ